MKGKKGKKNFEVEKDGKNENDEIKFLEVFGFKP